MLWFRSETSRQGPHCAGGCPWVGVGNKHQGSSFGNTRQIDYESPCFFAFSAVACWGVWQCTPGLVHQTRKWVGEADWAVWASTHQNIQLVAGSQLSEPLSRQTRSCCPEGPLTSSFVMFPEFAVFFQINILDPEPLSLKKKKMAFLETLEPSNDT